MVVVVMTPSRSRLHGRVPCRWQAPDLSDEELLGFAGSRGSDDGEDIGLRGLALGSTGEGSR